MGSKGTTGEAFFIIYLRMHFPISIWRSVHLVPAASKDWVCVCVLHQVYRFFEADNDLWALWGLHGQRWMRFDWVRKNEPGMRLC